MRGRDDHDETDADEHPETVKDDAPLPSSYQRRMPSTHPPDIDPHLGWHSRGYLPHCDIPGLIQHITFRLKEALPVRLRIEIDREALTLPEEERELFRRIRNEEVADAGYGCCILGSAVGRQAHGGGVAPP